MSNTHTNIIDREPTTRDIFDAILNFSKKVDEKFESVDGRFKSIDEQFKSIEQHFEKLEAEMSQGFTDIRNQIRQLWTKLDEVEKNLKTLSCRTLEDSDVAAKDIIVLQKEVKTLKQKVLKLETQHIS